MFVVLVLVLELYTFVWITEHDFTNKSLVLSVHTVIQVNVKSYLNVMIYTNENY